MAQVVETNVAQSVLAEDFGKVRGYVAWLYQIAEGIDADHIEIFFGVGATELLAVSLLFFFVPQQDFFELGHHIKASARGFGFHFFADDPLGLAVSTDLDYLLADADGIVVKVHVAPRYAEGFASSHSAVDREDDGNVQQVILGEVEECSHLVHRVGCPPRTAWVAVVPRGSSG